MVLGFIDSDRYCRLDSRVGAEEVIERLHGQMVRGGAKDGGSRISVRFADTSEQRELRVRSCQANS